MQFQNSIDHEGLTAVDPGNESAGLTALTEIKGVLFDLDGTLLNTLDDLAATMNDVLHRHRLPEHPSGEYRYFVGDGVDMLVRRALAPVSDEKIISRCTDEYKRKYALSWGRTTVPYDGIPELLDGLAAQRLFLAVLSNKPHYATTDMIRHYFGSRHFIACIGDGIFPRKPDPEAALYIAAMMGIHPSACLYIGDTGTDMDTAKAAGMPSAGALWGFRGEKELREKGAWWIARNPAQVLDIVKCSNIAM